MSNTFFQELSSIIDEANGAQITISKSSDGIITAKVVLDNVDIDAFGTPKEMDTELIKEILKAKDAKPKFSVKVTKKTKVKAKKKAVDTTDSTSTAAPESGQSSSSDQSDAKTSNNFKAVMHEADKLFLNKKYTESEVEYQKAVTLKPDNKKAIEGLAMAKKWVKAVGDL